jgi:hypothetical protein
MASTSKGLEVIEVTWYRKLGHMTQARAWRAQPQLCNPRVRFMNMDPTNYNPWNILE